MEKSRKRGFTLIELIVVITILGILATIAVPRFMNVTNKAQAAADMTTANAIATAVQVAGAERPDGDISKVQLDEVKAHCQIENLERMDPGSNKCTQDWGYQVVNGIINIYKKGNTIVLSR